MIQFPLQRNIPPFLFNAYIQDVSRIKALWRIFYEKSGLYSYRGPPPLLLRWVHKNIYATIYLSICPRAMSSIDFTHLVCMYGMYTLTPVHFPMPESENQSTNLNRYTHRYTYILYI